MQSCHIYLIIEIWSQKCIIRQFSHCLNMSVYLNISRRYSPLHSDYMVHRIEYLLFQLIEISLCRVSRVPTKISLWFAGQWDCQGLGKPFVGGGGEGGGWG